MRRDPVVIAMIAAGAVLAGWFLLGVADGATQVRVFWTVLPITDFLLGYFARRVTRMNIPADTRRFWRAVSRVSLVFIVGDASQTAVAWLHPGPAAAVPNPFQVATLLAGLGWVVWIMLTHPSRIATRQAKQRFWLDAASVLVGAGVLVWLLVLPTGTGQPKSALVALLLGTVVILVAAFAAVKLILSGNAPLSARAVAPMLLAGVLQGSVGALVGPEGARLGLLLAAQILSAVLLMAGPRLQELGGPPVPASERVAKPYSLLPYTTLAGLFAALPFVLHDGVGPDGWLLLGGLFVATVLAVSRQQLAFTENATLLRELRHQATHDGLTGLANRALFDATLADLTSHSAVLLVDLNDFKQVNDTHGHHAGDTVLTAVAARLAAVTPPGGMAARLGGDEFAILLPATDADEAALVGASFLARLDTPIHFDDALLSIRASVGIADGPPGDPDALLRRADTEMYRRKRAKPHPATDPAALRTATAR
ncbi:diguanylate cyclase domain-containing protein [Dactylosporangium sp. NPDC051541]|uniref:diguanylate cyclase domain-containing protein n=1 Tax=Dactylosporangium sp. NPDC051541 TaxID=3363977 RepID=UPI003788A92D